MLPFCPEGKWRHGNRRRAYGRMGVWAYGRMGVSAKPDPDLSAEAFPPPQDFKRSALRRRKAWFRIALGRSPISVNLRGLRLHVEDLSRRDSLKVAQYEVLGNDAKRHVRPGRDDRKTSGIWSRTPLSDCQLRSIVPAGTDVSFLHHFPALRTGLLLSLSPFLRPPGYGGQAGTKVLTVQPQPLSWHR